MSRGFKHIIHSVPKGGVTKDGIEIHQSTEDTDDMATCIEFMYANFTDTLRYPPVRWIGYSYTVYRLLHYGLAPGDDDRGDGENYIPLAATLGYVTGHALYHLIVAAIDVSDDMMDHCAVSVRNQYIAMAVGESLLWDMLASVFLPYMLGAVIYDLAIRRLPHFLSHRAVDGVMVARESVARVAAIAGLPLLGPVLDIAADRVLGLVTRDKFKLCPPSASSPLSGGHRMEHNFSLFSQEWLRYWNSIPSMWNF